MQMSYIEVVNFEFRTAVPGLFFADGRTETAAEKTLDYGRADKRRTS